jgi:hypothetical protein
MNSYNGAHVESHGVLPEPLARTGAWNIGTLALPAVMLSACSAAVFALVLLILGMGSRHELFVLQFPGVFVTGAVAAVLAWAIAFRCRRRPGRLWPRLWALCLACLNSTIALLGFVFHDRSWALALALAGLAAAATLLPRLLKLRPDSPMVQWVAPLSALMILLLILPTSCGLRRTIEKRTEQRVEQRIQMFRLWTTQVKEATEFDWRRMEESPEAAANAVATLKRLTFQSAVDDVDLWRAATSLGKDVELEAAMSGLTAEVVASLAPERVPRISGLREPAIRWDAHDRRWRNYTQFLALSEITGSYYREVGRMFDELGSEDRSGTSAKLVDYQQHYAMYRDAMRDHLNAVATTWADNWAVYRVPHHDALIGRQRLSLNELLRAPFIGDADQSLAPGQLLQLTALPLQRLKSMAQGTPGCQGSVPISRDQSKGEVRGALGCLCQNFDENGHEYFRLDCYSYLPRAQGTGADLRVEMRLVYQSAGRRLGRSSVPAEVYFHFLIPEGIDSDQFQAAVMTDLAAATRHFLTDESIRSTDRGGSVAGGFVIEHGRRSVRVRHPVVVLLNGLTPEPNALLVRVESFNDRLGEYSGG